jgi:hypothetical protein
MKNGLAGIIAVPAWARFMRDATAGSRPDWYDMPSDLERVKICSLSGARATDACRHQVLPAVMPLDDAALGTPVGTTGSIVEASTESVSVVPQLPATQPRGSVYEDIFPIGAVPSEECPLHNGRFGYYQTSAESMTPLVDAAVGTTGSAATMRSVNSRFYVERVVGPDGITRLVMKQR